MPLQFGSLSVDEWNTVIHALPEPTPSVSAAHTAEVPSSASASPRSIRNLTWAERLERWKSQEREDRKYVTSTLRSKFILYGPRIKQANRPNGCPQVQRERNPKAEHLSVSSERKTPPPCGEEKRGPQLVKERARSSSNAWQQPRPGSPGLRVVNEPNGHTPSSWGSENTVRGNELRRTVPSGGCTSLNPTRDAYSTNFPDALANGKAVTPRDLAGSDFDYEDKKEELLETLENRTLASGLPIMPVGLVNPSSTCYMNVILQSLYSCDHLTRILATKNFSYRSNLLKKLHLFYLRIALHEKDEINRVWPSPLVPSLFYDVFPPTNGDSNNNKTFSQEDAQEFFAHVLNRIHDEIIKAKTNEKSEVSHMNGTRSVLDWSLVGVGGRRIRNREMDAGEHQRVTVASELFGGLTLSEIVHTGKNRMIGESRNKRYERFYSLGLEVGNGTSSIEDGLKKYFTQERLENGMVKSLDIVTWPKVLVIQLMRFRYKKETKEVEKVTQKCSYPEFLEVEDSARVAARGRARRREQYRYRLVSVVTHHGKDIASGHYTCDVWRDGKGEDQVVDTSKYTHVNGRSKRSFKGDQSPWFRDLSGWYSCDDSKMSDVSLEEVLSRQAYLLFYVMI